MRVDASNSAPTVFFYTGGFTHTFHRHQFACSPEGFRVVPSTPELISEGMKPDIRAAGTLRQRISLEAKRAAVAVFEKVGVPNARSMRRRRGDLIHSAQHLLRTSQPWVVDYEDVSVLFWYRHRLLEHARARRSALQMLQNDNCRRLLPWTQAAADSLASAFGTASPYTKTEVVYPAIKGLTDPLERMGPKTPVRLLFVGTRFYQKGGLETLRAFRGLRAQLPVELTMVTFVPEEVRAEIAATEGLTVLSKVSPERMRREFANADIFVLPPHTDTFGFVYLEAFSNATPCVGTDHFAVPEIISHGRTGLLVAAENSYFGADRLPRFDPVDSDSHSLMSRLREPSEAYVRSLEEALTILAGDASLRTEMGESAFEEVRSGRFSCMRRRHKMAHVYREALEER